MAIFLVTIGIGIPNGAQRRGLRPQPDPDPRPLGDRRLADAHDRRDVVPAVPRRRPPAGRWRWRSPSRSTCSAFYTGSFAVPGDRRRALLLAVILWLFAWVWRTYLAGERSLPRLGIALAITTFTYGAIVGVLLQVSFCDGRDRSLPGDSDRRPRGRDDVRLPRPRRHVGRWSGSSSAPPGCRAAASSSSSALFAGRPDPVGRAARRRGAARRHVLPAGPAGLGRPVQRPGAAQGAARRPGWPRPATGTSARRRCGSSSPWRCSCPSSPSSSPTRDPNAIDPGLPRRERPLGVHRRDHELDVRGARRARGRRRGRRPGDRPPRSCSGA